MKTASKLFPSSSVAVEPTTGVAYTGFYDIVTVGAGYLDITAAFSCTDIPAGTALLPKAVWGSASLIVLINGEN